METEGEAPYGALWVKTQKGKGIFVSHSAASTPREQQCISLVVIGSQTLLFGIDLKRNEIQLKLFFDPAAEPWKYNRADWYDGICDSGGYSQMIQGM